MNIRNLQKLSTDELANEYFTSKIQSALDLTTKELLKQLDDIIDADVYSWSSIGIADRPWGYPNSPYRSGQFKKSWETEKATIVANIVEAKIDQDISVMREYEDGENPKAVVHHDKENLAEYINNNTNYDLPYAQFHIDKKPKKPFWDDFIAYVDKNLDEMLIKNCKKVGLQMI